MSHRTRTHGWDAQPGNPERVEELSGKRLKELAELCSGILKTRPMTDEVFERLTTDMAELAAARDEASCPRCDGDAHPYDSSLTCVACRHKEHLATTGENRAHHRSQKRKGQESSAA